MPETRSCYERFAATQTPGPGWTAFTRQEVVTWTGHDCPATIRRAHEWGYSWPARVREYLLPYNVALCLAQTHCCGAKQTYWSKEVDIHLF